MKKININELSIDEKIRLLNGVGSWKTYDCNHKIPSLTLSDGPHGLRKQDDKMYADINNSIPSTCFPTAATIACSFDIEVAKTLAKSIALEAKKEKVDIVLGCGTNIKRSPLCGRNFEYFSEDPLLSGSMASSYVSAMENEGIMTSLKHYACNNQETTRMTSNSVVDKRALHEIYLSSFIQAIEQAHPSSIMTSYNLINGTHASSNKVLLDIARNAGFDGMFLSDWGGTINIVDSIKAGLNLEMPDSSLFHTNLLKKAYKENKISEEEINKAAIKVLEAAYKKQDHNVTVDYALQHKIATELAKQSAVLLKNDGLLPLSQKHKIAVVGELAENMRIQGSGSSHINPTVKENFIDILNHENIQFDYFKGYSTSNDKTYISNDFSQYDVVLYFMGLTDNAESEGFDRTHLNIPENQINVLSALPKDKTVCVCFGGSPFVIPYRNEVNAILMMYLSGQGSARATYDLLFGIDNPSGKLAETWPLDVKDTPCYGNYGLKDENVLYSESIFVGYRYYSSYNIPVQYEFGHGLSYTSFKYSKIICDENHVEFDLTNTGKYSGKEVSLVFCKNDLSIKRPFKELIGFTKTYLEPNETKHISIPYHSKAFTIYDTNTDNFVKVDGNYTIEVNTSLSTNQLSEQLHINGEKIDSTPLDIYPSFDTKPVFDKFLFEKLFDENLPLLSSNRNYDITDSFETICNASFIGRCLQKIIIFILNMVVKDGKDSSSYKLILNGLNESPLESLVGLSNGMLKIGLLNYLVKRANKENKNQKI